MPGEKPGTDDEVIATGPAEGEQGEKVEVAVDEELASALKIVGDATKGVGLTQTLNATVSGGVLDLSDTDTDAIDTERAVGRLLAAEEEVDL